MWSSSREPNSREVFYSSTTDWTSQTRLGTAAEGFSAPETLQFSSAWTVQLSSSRNSPVEPSRTLSFFFLVLYLQQFGLPGLDSWKHSSPSLPAAGCAFSRAEEKQNQQQLRLNWATRITVSLLFPSVSSLFSPEDWSLTRWMKAAAVLWSVCF